MSKKLKIYLAKKLSVFLKNKIFVAFLLSFIFLILYLIIPQKIIGLIWVWSLFILISLILIAFTFEKVFQIKIWGARRFDFLFYLVLMISGLAFCAWLIFNIVPLVINAIF